MKQKIYSIYDQCAKAYNSPFYMHNDAMAIRALQANVNNPDSNINKNPEDFILYVLGEFDDSTASFNMHEAPEKVAMAISLKDPAPEDNFQKTLDIILQKVSKL